MFRAVAHARALGHAGAVGRGILARVAIEPASSVETALRPVGATEAARVVRVVDGDTLVIDRGLGDERLRYIGMDAPESVKPGSPVEFMGREASAANAALVEGREIVLERDVSETDQYDRLLRYAWLRDGDAWLMVNLELVRQGYAQVATYPPDVRWTDELRAAERAARDAGRGSLGPGDAAALTPWARGGPRRPGRTIDPESPAQENGPMDPVLEPRKTIGLVAHDNKKADLIEWCHYNRALLRPPQPGRDRDDRHAAGGGAATTRSGGSRAARWAGTSSWAR